MALKTDNRLSPAISLPDRQKLEGQIKQYTQHLHTAIQTLVTKLSGVINSLSMVGTASQLPAAGNAGRFFYSADTATLYEDDGTKWQGIAFNGFGGTLASASSVTLTATVHKISGTTAIHTINPPSGFTAGPIYLIPTDLWRTSNSGGNIALSTAAVVNQALVLVYDGSLWYPSYT